MKLIPTAKRASIIKRASNDEKSIDDVGVRTSAASEKSVIPFININVCSDETIPVGGCTFVPFVGEKLMHGAAITKILLIQQILSVITVYRCNFFLIE
jgi:hypothetical protein